VSRNAFDEVRRMAAELGWTHLDRDGKVRLEVPVGEETVTVYVRNVGEIHEREVLEFASCGVELPEDDAAKMPVLILALQRNADVLFGHWGLEEEVGGSVLRVFHSQIAETMDRPELRAAAMAVGDEFLTLTEALDEVLHARRPSMVAPPPKRD
jgi:hypothetical protein